MNPALIILDFPLLKYLERDFKENFFGETGLFLGVPVFRDIAEFILTFPPYCFAYPDDYFEWLYNRAESPDYLAVDEIMEHLCIWAYEEVSQYVIQHIRGYIDISKEDEYRFLYWLDSDSALLQHVGKPYWTGSSYE